MRMTKNGSIWFLSALSSSVFLCQLFLSLSSYVFVFVFVKWSNCPLVLPCGSVSVLWLLVAIVGHLLGNHLPRIRTVPRCPFLQPFGLQWSWESWWGGDYNTQYCLLLQICIPLDIPLNIPSRGKHEPNMMWLWLWCVFVKKIMQLYIPQIKAASVCHPPFPVASEAFDKYQVFLDGNINCSTW